MKQPAALSHPPGATRRPGRALLTPIGLLSVLACAGPAGSSPGSASSGSEQSEASEQPEPLADAPAEPLPGSAEGSSAQEELPAPYPEGVSCGAQVCSAFASCATTNGLAGCQCAAGLDGDGLRCGDVDECAQAPDLCGAHGSCENTFGSYRCGCEPGYVWNGSDCVDQDECEQHPCDPAAACRNDVAGGFSCSCGADSFGDGFFCNASDACAGHPCGDHGACQNLPEGAGGAGYVCQCEPGYAGQVDCSPCGDQLVLTDPGLRLAVNRQLGRSGSDTSPIPLAALSGQTALDASGLQVTDLAGLSCWPGLESLNLSHNSGFAVEQNVAELAQLNRLTELWLDCTAATDLNALAAHPALRVLSVNALGCELPTQLTDASAAGRIPGLEYLDLRGQGLDGVGFLGGARNLRSLWLGHNQLQSPADLRNLRLLRELDLDSNGLRDLEGLEGMLQLQTLNVAYNQLSDLERTAALPSLRVINASDNAVGALPDWSGLAQLREVTLSANQLASVAPLAPLRELGWLNLAGNQIDTLSPLIDGAAHGTLVIEGNPLPCSEEAGHIRALRAHGVDVKGGCQP